MKRIRPISKKIIQSFGLLCLILLVLTNCQNKSAPPFSIGADISFVPQNEARRGVTYTDVNGEAKEI